MDICQELLYIEPEVQGHTQSAPVFHRHDIWPSRRDPGSSTVEELPVSANIPALIIRLCCKPFVCAKAGVPASNAMINNLATINLFFITIPSFIQRCSNIAGRCIVFSFIHYFFGKVMPGNVAQMDFWGWWADVMARYRRVTSAHHRQIRLRGLLADVTLPETESVCSDKTKRASPQRSAIIQISIYAVFLRL